MKRHRPGGRCDRTHWISRAGLSQPFRHGNMGVCRRERSDQSASWRLRAAVACSRLLAASSLSIWDAALRTAPCVLAISAAFRSFIELSAKMRDRLRSGSMDSDIGQGPNAVSTLQFFGVPWVHHGASSTRRRSRALLSDTREADGPGGPCRLGAPPVHRRGGRTECNRHLPAWRFLAAY